ncbi:alpha/beta hydrolase [Clostridium sp. AL.422]|uniref:alpha/beta hydrolase n=1 Tax=Clostridium TaxID=1485 RepID=UPI00293DFBBA|nr:MULTISPECIES: alpha/beta fold hydrolase [unclassified Clostridium]MDV4152083.1 alpha/beta hydrolase [Clostridium sp. AL.422]
MKSHKEYISHVNNSRTVVVFIHGILEGPNQFNDFIEIIDNKISVVNLLLPGHGGSGKDFRNSNMTEWKSYIYNIIVDLEMSYENIFIVGHSMGALLAVDASLNYPKKIKGLFLLAIPICIHLQLTGVINSIKVAFNLVRKNDLIALAAKKVYSITTKNILTFLTWIPRYIELFKEANNTKNRISKIDILLIIYQSNEDEFVSNRTLNYINNNDNIELHILKKSKHFYYCDEERKIILNSFVNFIESNI